MIKTNKDLLKYIRSLDNIQLNKEYRNKYIRSLKAEIKDDTFKYSNIDIKHMKYLLRDLDKKWPYIEKIKVEIC